MWYYNTDRQFDDSIQFTETDDLVFHIPFVYTLCILKEHALLLMREAACTVAPFRFLSVSEEPQKNPAVLASY